MKNISVILLFVLAIFVIFTSCQDKEIVPNEVAELKEKKQLKTALKAISWNVADSIFDNEFIGWIELVDGIDETEAVKLELVIVGSSDGFVFTVNEHSNPVGFSPQYAIVCSGRGVSFVNCCKNWFEEHPGGCLTIRTDGNGNYTASDNGC